MLIFDENPKSMKKAVLSVFSVLVLLLVFSGCPGEEKKGDDVVPLDCEPLPGSLGPLHFCKMEHNWGAIQQGDSIFGFFTFKNSKDYPVTIKQIFTSCECVQAEYPVGPIKPGSYHQIIGKFFSADQPVGKYEKIMAVLVEGEEVPYSLMLKGTVNPPAQQ